MNKILTIKYNHEINQRDMFDISDINIPVLREFNAFKSFVDKAIYKKYDYSGIVSPKFEKKTGLAIEHAIAMIDEDYDVILYHPYPLELQIQNDFLHLAEMEHPGIRLKLQMLWEIIYNEKLPILELNESLNFCVHSNYVVANRKFWNMYSKDIVIIDELIKHKRIEFLFEDTPYNLSDTNEIKLPIFPFVFERYLSHYLYKHQDLLRIKNICIDPSFQQVELFKYEKNFIAILSLLLQLKCIDEKTMKNFIVYIYFAVRKQIFNLKRDRNEEN